MNEGLKLHILRKARLKINGLHLIPCQLKGLTNNKGEIVTTSIAIKDLKDFRKGYEIAKSGVKLFLKEEGVK